MDKKKIVVIDDEKDVCFLIKTTLEKAGQIEVSEAHDGLAGLDLCRKVKPDLIFLDYVMPKASGDKVIFALKKDPELSAIPVVVLSGLGEMIYSRAKDHWNWLPNNPAVRHRDEIPTPLADKKEKDSVVAQALGVKDFLRKPLSRELLVQVANSILKIGEEPKES